MTSADCQPLSEPRSPIENRLPRLVLIADGFTGEVAAARAVDAAEAGVPWIHLRDHAAEAHAFRQAAGTLAARLRGAAPGVQLSVNGRLGVAERLGAGLHTGRHGPAVGEARERLGGQACIGFSAHSVEEARRAAGADYFFFSPVFPTGSKPGHPGAGLDALRRFCRAFPGTPVLALGGVTPGRVAPCLDAGAWGVAVLSGILRADDPARAIAAYLNALPGA